MLHAAVVSALTANIYVLLYAVIGLYLDASGSRRHTVAMILGALGVFGAMMLAHYNWPQWF